MSGPLATSAGPTDDAARLRTLCHALLGLLDTSPAVPPELVAAISGGVGDVADGLRRELAAWDAVLDRLRNLPSQYITPTPAVAALIAELEAARAAGAGVVAALDGLQTSPIPARPSRPTRWPSPNAFPPPPAADTRIDLPVAETLADRPNEAERADLLVRQAMDCQSRQEIDRADELYSDALDLDPSHLTAQLRRGQVRLVRGLVADAVADFSAVIEVDDTVGEAWGGRGDAHAVAGRLDAAVGDYTRALALRPESVRVRCNLGVALRQSGQGGRALAEFDRVIAARPDHVTAHLNRGLIFLHQGHPGRAAEAFRTALDHDPDCEVARQYLDVIGRPPHLAPEPTPEPATAAVLPADPAPPPTPPAKKKAAPKTEAGRVVVKCPNCGAEGSVPWNRLGSVFECGGCDRRFGVQPDGTMVEVKTTTDGKWTAAVPPRERARQKRRWVAAGVAAALLLVLPGSAVLGMQAFAAKPEPAERELPTGLNERAELLAQAWMSNDVRLMKRLTTPAQEKQVYAWYTRHRPPPALRGPSDGTQPDGAKIEVTPLPGKGKDGQVQVRVRISNPTLAPSQPPVEMTWTWEQRGDAWYFLPPSK